VRSAKANHRPLGAAYARDYHAWAIRQAEALRARELVELDLENLAEEVEDLARQVKWEVQHRAEVLLTHLLKWQHQAEKQGTSWQATIDEQRDRIADLLAENPSLAPQVGTILNKAYRYARREAGLQMSLSKAQSELQLPRACPWDRKQILNPEFLPRARK
jgi:Domain of unknown function DUF29